MRRRHVLALGLAAPFVSTMARAQTEPSRDYPQILTGRGDDIISPDLPIIDAHHHLIDRPGLRYMIDDYLADTNAGHRVVASVYVETLAFARVSGPEVLRPIGEIEFANGIGQMCESGRYGCRACSAIVGSADLRLGDQIAQLLDLAMVRAPERYRGVRQVTMEHSSPAPYRFIPNRPPSGIMESPGFRPAFTHLVKRGLSFDAAVFDHQLPDIIELADAFPTAAIVINHCGQAMAMDMTPSQRQDAFNQWRQMIIEAGRRPNLFCKVGGLGMPFWGFRFEERTDPIGYMELAETWRPWVETVIDAFGAERCMMESNYPPDARSAGFVPLWNALKHIVRDASENENASLFHDTAAKFYRITSPEERQQ
jgi:L-fuconolactonase